MSRVVAILLIIIGGVGLLVSCQMDTSVPSFSGGRVINLPMAAQQQNSLLVSAVLFIAGIVLFTTTKPTSTKRADDLEREPAVEKIAESEKAARSFLKAVSDDVVGLTLRQIFAWAAISLLLAVILLLFGLDLKIAMILGIIGGYFFDRKRRSRPVKERPPSPNLLDRD